MTRKLDATLVLLVCLSAFAWMPLAAPGYFLNAHDAPHSVARQQYPPDDLVGRDYYEPTANGAERDIAIRLERLRKIVRGK